MQERNIKDKKEWSRTHHWQLVEVQQLFHQTS